MVGERRTVTFDGSEESSGGSGSWSGSSSSNSESGSGSGSDSGSDVSCSYESSGSGSNRSSESRGGRERRRAGGGKKKRKKKKGKRRRKGERLEGPGSGHRQRIERSVMAAHGSSTSLDGGFECISVKSHRLEGMETQRMVPNFFHYVYLKDDELNSCPGVLIPDTILYVDGKPEEWLFVSKEGRILKKRADRLNSGCILRSFLRPTSYRTGPVVAKLIKVRRNVGGDESFMAVSYLTEETLREFLANPRKARYMVLQRFVDPYGTHNEVVKVHYAGIDTAIERRRNVHHIDDWRVDLASRMQVFEGRHPESEVDPWSLRSADEALRDRVHKLAFDVVNHVREFSVLHYSVQSMNLFFKVGPKHRLWLISVSHVNVVRPSTKKERSVATKVMKQIQKIGVASGNLAPRRSPGGGRSASITPTKTALTKAVSRFKDLRSSVFSGHAKASDPGFVNSLLKKEVARLQAVLASEKRAIIRSQSELHRLESIIHHEDTAINHLRSLAAEGSTPFSTYLSMANLHSDYKAGKSESSLGPSPSPSPSTPHPPSSPPASSPSSPPSSPSPSSLSPSISMSSTSSDRPTT